VRQCALPQPALNDIQNVPCQSGVVTAEAAEILIEHCFPDSTAAITGTALRPTPTPFIFQVTGVGTQP